MKVLSAAVVIGLLGGCWPRGAAADPPAQASRERFRRGVASVAFDVEVKPPGKAAIAGFVLDRDGGPVKRACVELDLGGRAPAPVFSTSNGSYRFAGVPPGRARVTITVASPDLVAGKRIADHHHQDPDLTVLLRPLVMLPANGRLSIARIKRQADVPGQQESWIEVAPIALDLDGYSAGCQRALARSNHPARARRAAGRH